MDDGFIVRTRPQSNIIILVSVPHGETARVLSGNYDPFNTYVDALGGALRGYPW